MTRTFTTWVVVLLSLFLSETAPMLAQVGPPSRVSANGLFGRTGEPSDRPALDLSGSLYGGYDTDVVAGLVGGEGGGNRPRSRQAGGLTGASADLSYSRPGERVEFDLSGRVGVTHTPGSRAATATNYAGRGSLSGALGESTQLRIGALYQYLPRFGLGTGLFQLTDDGGLPLINNGVQDLDPLSLTAIQQTAQLGLTQDLTRRSSLNFSYNMARTDFSAFPRDLMRHNGQAYYQYEVTQGTSLRLGYGYNSSRYEQTAQPDRSFEYHEIIAGLNHTQAFSLTRGTTLGFSVGSTLTQQDSQRLAESGTDGDVGSLTRFFLTGNANLTHEIGRSWTANLNYGRGVRFLDGFNEPQLTDTVTAGVAGLLSRRTDFSVFAAYGRGSAATGQSQAFSSYQASAQVRIAMGRQLSLFTQYFYNRYDGAFLDFGQQFAIPGAFNRHGVMAGLNAWIPFLR